MESIDSVENDFCGGSCIYWFFHKNGDPKPAFFSSDPRSSSCRGLGPRDEFAGISSSCRQRGRRTGWWCGCRRGAATRLAPSVEQEEEKDCQRSPQVSFAYWNRERSWERAGASRCNHLCMTPFARDLSHIFSYFRLSTEICPPPRHVRFLQMGVRSTYKLRSA